MEADIKKSAEPIMKEFDKVQASNFAREVTPAVCGRLDSAASIGAAPLRSCRGSDMDPSRHSRDRFPFPFAGTFSQYVQETMAEILASSAYDTSTVAEGREASVTLRNLANSDGDGDEGDDVCCSVPREVLEEGEAPDTTMFGTTSLHSFAQLVQHVDIDCIVKVLYKHKPDRKVGHLVVLGPNGFQLCTCLQLMRLGLQCRHVFAALVTHLKRGGDFRGDSIHPRWRSSGGRWSLETAGLGKFEGDESCESYDGGFTGDWGQVDDFGDLPEESTSSRIAVARGRTYANLMEMCQRAVRMFVDNMTTDFQATDQYMFGALMRAVQDHVKRGDGGGAESLNAIKDPPVYQTRNRKQKRHKDCTEARGGASAKRVKTEKE